MVIIRLLPVILANLLFAAHMSRSYNDVLALLVLLFTFTLFITKRWLLRIWQVYLVLGGMLWIVDTVGLVQGRIANQAPWTRLAIILSLVSLFSFFAAYWLEKPSLKKQYPIAKED